MAPSALRLRRSATPPPRKKAGAVEDLMNSTTSAYFRKELPGTAGTPFIESI